MMLASSVTVATCLLFYLHRVSACTDTVYAGTADGQVAISIDGGNTWSTLLNNSGTIYSIRASGNNVYAGTPYGIAVSHNGGVSWMMQNLQISSGCRPTVLSVFVDEHQRVYALTGIQRGCYRVAISSDNGDTWPTNFALPNPPFADYPQNIYVDGSRIYVVNYNGLGFSDDLGASWTFVNQSSGLGSNMVQCVIAKGRTIYAGMYTDGGPVSMSKDSGLTWKTVNTTPTAGLNDGVWTMYLQDQTLYVATWGGGLSWTKDFITWTTKTTADGLASNTTYAITGSGENNLYLDTFDGGLSISRDKGRTWISKTTEDGLPSDNVSAVCVKCV